MAAPAPVSSDTPIVIKISVNNNLKKLKLPLRDLGAAVLPGKLRQVLDIKPEQHMLLERFSDSSGGYVTLSESSPQVFKTLIRAAKAKGKLRLKATVTPETKVESEELPAQQTKPASPRESTALDRRSVGSGIFEFREARDRASQQTLINLSEEAPVPRPFVDSQSNFFDKLADAAAQPLAFRTREVVQPSTTIGRAWSVYCNECDKAMDDVHFHCSICDGGDYDLCKECVGENKHCPGEGHWLIKRFIKNGAVVPSETERVSPRKTSSPPSVPTCTEKIIEKAMPGAFSVSEEPKIVPEEVRVATRTCNCCVIVLPEHEFVTCSTCDDFDLCIKCVGANKHGHHPAHSFEPATPETVLPLAAQAKLAAGRNVRHSAVCDGCDKPICGVRHKCLVCPDWDYCNDCVKTARHNHPRHRFAPLYEPIGDQQVASMVRHFGIYCDGPLCSSKHNQSYIHGVRYKCTICSDTDFCGSCEALPGNHHNRTHPLIKFKTPVRNVNVMTENEDVRGNVKVLGDRRCPAPTQPTKSTATETTPFLQTNAATQVQTVAEIMPTEVKKETMPIPIPVKKFVESTPATPEGSVLNAHFVRDSIPDGMKMQPETCFAQTWILTNPGPHAWPAGCSVRYVGGDNMLNVDNNHPASVSTIADATESNVVGREVQVGEVVAFKVVLKAPVREGKSISYWRLKSADGTPFGHRLWCDIEVKKEEEDQAQLVPSFNESINALVQDQQAQQAQIQAQMTQAQFRAQQFRTQQLQVQQLQQAQQARIQAQQAQMQAQVQAQQAHQAQRARLQQMALARSEHVAQQKKAIAAHQQARELRSNPQPSVGDMSTGRSHLPPVYRPFEAPRQSEEPPAYDAMNLSARLAAMREQQKQRREQMMAQLSAQRDANQARGFLPSAAPNFNHPGRGSPDATAHEKERREALKQRVAHIKANILKTREEREKLTAELSQRNAIDTETLVSDKKAVDDAKVQKIVDQVVQSAAEDDKKLQVDVAEEKTEDKTEDKTEENLSDSQMVFPKLDKESPASSLYGSATSGSSKAKAAYVENEEGEVERAAIPVSIADPAPSVSAADEDDFVDLDDELEVLSASGDESDDGFLTDEEYDILDASDSETVASGFRG